MRGARGEPWHWVRKGHGVWRAGPQGRALQDGRSPRARSRRAMLAALGGLEHADCPVPSGLQSGCRLVAFLDAQLFRAV